MVCCRCNRSGFCKGCACVKAKRTCDSCLPGKLGHCANNSTTNGNFIKSPTPRTPPMSSPTFTWGNLSGPEFDKLLDATYDEVVHWRRNCSSVPFGKAGRDFVSELSRLYLAHGSASTLEAVALKAATVLPILLLQEPSKKSKTKDHTKCLERRLASWSNGNLEELVREGGTLQQRLPRDRSAGANTNLARSFANLMLAPGHCHQLGLAYGRETWVYPHSQPVWPFWCFQTQTYFHKQALRTTHSY